MCQIRYKFLLNQRVSDIILVGSPAQRTFKRTTFHNVTKKCLKLQINYIIACLNDCKENPILGRINATKNKQLKFTPKVSVPIQLECDFSIFNSNINLFIPNYTALGILFVAHLQINVSFHHENLQIIEKVIQNVIRDENRSKNIQFCSDLEHLTV